MLALGELKLGPVGGVACDVGDLDALGDLDLKPNEVGPHIHVWLFCAAATATATAGSAAAAAATHQGNRGKETDAEGENRKGLLFHGRVLLDL